eukprot:RCo000123
MVHLGRRNACISAGGLVQKEASAGGGLPNRGHEVPRTWVSLRPPRSRSGMSEDSGRALAKTFGALSSGSNDPHEENPPRLEGRPREEPREEPRESRRARSVGGAPMPECTEAERGIRALGLDA